MYRACVGTRFHLHWAADPSLYCHSSHVAMPVAFHLVLTVSSLLWTPTPFSRICWLKLVAIVPTKTGTGWPLTSEDAVTCLCVFGESQGEPGQCSTDFVHHCLVGYLCLCYKKEVMRMAVEGKMRWNNQWSWAVVADINKRCPCGFFLWKYMWPKDADDPRDERKQWAKAIAEGQCEGPQMKREKCTKTSCNM